MLGKLYGRYAKQFKVAGLALSDVLILNIVSILALWMRYEFQWNSIPEVNLDRALAYAPVYTLLTLVIFAAFGMYTSLWRYAGIYEMVMLECALVLTTVVQYLGMGLMGMKMPMAYYIFSFILNALFFSADRCFYRFLGLLHTHLFSRGNAEDRAMIVGAGEAGNVILKEIINSKYLNGQVSCLIDDDPEKQGKKIHGIQVI